MLLLLLSIPGSHLISKRPDKEGQAGCLLWKVDLRALSQMYVCAAEPFPSLPPSLPPFTTLTLPD